MKGHLQDLVGISWREHVLRHRYRFQKFLESLVRSRGAKLGFATSYLQDDLDEPGEGPMGPGLLLLLEE